MFIWRRFKWCKNLCIWCGEKNVWTYGGTARSMQNSQDNLYGSHHVQVLLKMHRSKLYQTLGDFSVVFILDKTNNKTTKQTFAQFPPSSWFISGSNSGCVTPPYILSWKWAPEGFPFRLGVPHHTNTWPWCRIPSIVVVLPGWGRCVCWTGGDSDFFWWILSLILTVHGSEIPNNHLRCIKPYK